MILSLFGKSTSDDAVFRVYNAIVAQSRQARFYADWSVPDTVTGRFDMISLHMALLFRRLRSDNPAHKAFSQAVFDLFFRDMDRSLRQMGAGDLAVPKKIKKMGNIFFGLLAALNEAMDRSDPDVIADVLARNIFDTETSAGIAPMTQYLLASDKFLAGQSDAAIIGGTLSYEAQS